MNRLKITSLITYGMLSILIFLLDHTIKKHTETWPLNAPARDSLLPFIKLRNYHNYGAFLNTGDKKPKVVALISVLLTLGICVFSILTFFQTGNKVLKFGLSLLLGGAFSNTYDRLVKKHVSDYASFHTGIRRLDRVIFNLSDLCILVGTVLVMLEIKL